MPLFDASKFTAAKAKPLPVILLLDNSVSMATDNNIGKLNQAVKKMLASLVAEENQNTEFLVSVITFGREGAKLLQAPTSAANVELADLTIADHGNDGTPLGAALDEASNLIDATHGTFAPVVVLVSDGEPNDDHWSSKLEKFISEGRTAKCDRMALAIGASAISGRGRPALDHFVKGTEREVKTAENASEIRDFFRYVTMSVVARSNSQNPNQIPSDNVVAATQLNPTATPPTKPYEAAPEANGAFGELGLPVNDDDDDFDYSPY